MKTIVKLYFKALRRALGAATDAILEDEDLAIHAFYEMKTGARAIVSSLEEHKPYSNKQYQRIKPILKIVDEMIKIEEQLSAEAEEDNLKFYNFPKNTGNVEH